jgi:hypothetical protein
MGRPAFWESVEARRDHPPRKVARRGPAMTAINAARCSTARSRMRRAASSPAAASSSTSGARAARRSGPRSRIHPARRLSMPPIARKVSRLRASSGTTPSSAAKQCRNAFRPIQLPPPRSPQIPPQALATGCAAEQSQEALQRTDNDVKLAILMTATGMSVEEAKSALRSAGCFLRKGIANSI